MADEKDTEVFDEALKNAHPIFHGYLKAAKQHAIASRQFSNYVDSLDKKSDDSDNK